MKRTFYYNERRKQSNLYKTGFFGSARNGGLWTILDDDGNKTGVATDLDFILVPDDSKENMFAPIRQDALDYFNRYDISWWRQDEDGSTKELSQVRREPWRLRPGCMSTTTWIILSSSMTCRCPHLCNRTLYR